MKRIIPFLILPLLACGESKEAKAAYAKCETRRLPSIMEDESVEAMIRLMWCEKAVSLSPKSAEYRTKRDQVREWRDTLVAAEKEARQREMAERLAAAAEAQAAATQAQADALNSQALELQSQSAILEQREWDRRSDRFDREWREIQRRNGAR